MLAKDGMLYIPLVCVCVCVRAWCEQKHGYLKLRSKLIPNNALFQNSPYYHWGSIDETISLLFLTINTALILMVY